MVWRVGQLTLKPSNDSALPSFYFKVNLSAYNLAKQKQHLCPEIFVSRI